MNWKLGPTPLLLFAYFLCSVTLLAAWNLWERAAGLAVTMGSAIVLELVARRSTVSIVGPSQPGEATVVLRPPLWYRLGMGIGVLAGLAGVIGGGASLIVESNATLVGPALAPPFLLAFLRPARGRVVIRPTQVVVANFWWTHSIARHDIVEVHEQDHPAPRRARVTLALLDGRQVPVGFAGSNRWASHILSADEVSALADGLRYELGLSEGPR